MFICSTIFLYFIDYKINNILIKNKTKFMEKFFLIIAIILTFLYLVDNFMYIILIIFC